MTTSEFKNEFLISYDKVTNFTAPGYTDYEISVFLTEAQERFVKQRYNPKGNKYQEGFENTEKRRVDLSELVKSPYDSNGNLLTGVSSNQVGVHVNGTFFDLPSDCLYLISEEILVSSSDTCIDGNILDVTPMKHDEYTSNKGNPFKKPDNNFAWRLDFSRESATVNPKRVELITNGEYTITEYYPRYIKKPNPIIIDDVSPKTINGISATTECELDESTHREIINIAVFIALETTGDPRTNTQGAELNLTE